jgi:hypothetical protein
MMAESRLASGRQSRGMAVLRISGLAGIFGPITFVIVYTILGFVSVGYSPITQVISNLELVQNGWIQQLNFLQCGTLIIVFAVGFRRALLGIVQRHLRLGTAFFVLSGAGMVDASYFTPATPIEHTVGFLFFIIPLTASFFLVGRQLLRSDSWHAIGVYTLVSGFVTLALLLSFFFLGASGSFGFVGVVNRLFVMEALAWFVVIGTRLFRSKQ